jgi:hypothetical protein
MNTQKETLRSANERSGQLPPIGVVVWVRAAGYGMMAYRDTNGVWRCVGSGKELKGVTVVSTAS